ncbi:MAG: BamA/TamA family outer membrane protein [Flavobacteriaceae bacterium]|nr:BamA/TamA family outer membrane protein [Flavobacteriaceae bacterium]
MPLKSYTFETNLNAYLLKTNFIILLIFTGIIFGFLSCNSVKYVGENEFLLVKNKVIVNDKKNSSDEINDYIVQRPNQLVLGVALPLHFYNLGNKNFETDYDQWKLDSPGWYNFTSGVFSEKQARGVRNFKYKMHQWILKNGEPPVILDTKKASQTVKNLTQHYYNEGYFNVKADFEEHHLKNRKASIDYIVDKDRPNHLDSITTNIQSAVLDSIYEIHKSKSFIKEGNQFRLSLFVNEQNRLTNLFRNSGIYRFYKNAITFEVDTSATDYKSDVVLLIDDNTGSVPFKVQKIQKVNIYTDYSFSKSGDNSIKDSISYKGFSFFAQEKLKYNPKYLLNSISIEPNDIYKDETRELTRKNLRGLQNFRTVDIKYEELDNDMLEASIYLSPLKKYSIGINTELTHSNIRQLGISGKLSFLDRNIFRGAELLKFSIQGSFLDSKDAADNSGKLLNAWEIGGDISLELPRFVFPVKFEKLIPKSMAPKTIFTLGTSLQKNIGLDKQIFTGIVDYTWESSKTINHSFQLLNVQFIKNLNVESYFKIYKSEFNEIQQIANTYFNDTLTTDNAIGFIDTKIDANFEESNPEEYRSARDIRNRYNIITEDVLVPLMAYTFTYNNSENYKDTDFSFFRSRVGASGNLTTLLAKNRDVNNKKTLFGIPIAQYVRVDLEYKKFWNVSKETVLVYRSFLGVAVPYGNSNTIPFSRSYFIGGPNDLRAWKIYDLGPGSTKTGLEYNVGNLKFINSLEYRFNVINSINGALFVDAGNIWDISNGSITASEGKFKGINSIKDIAIGSGFGLRYDLSFILLRLDLGFKTYEPYLSEREKWFKNYNFAHAVFNFGISYPF